MTASGVSLARSKLRFGSEAGMRQDHIKEADCLRLGKMPCIVIEPRTRTGHVKVLCMDGSVKHVMPEELKPITD